MNNQINQLFLLTSSDGRGFKQEGEWRWLQQPFKTSLTGYRAQYVKKSVWSLWQNTMHLHSGKQDYDWCPDLPCNRFLWLQRFCWVWVAQNSEDRESAAKLQFSIFHLFQGRQPIFNKHLTSSSKKKSPVTFQQDTPVPRNLAAGQYEYRFYWLFLSNLAGG